MTPIEFVRPRWDAPRNVTAFMTARRGGASRCPYGSADGGSGGLNLGDHVGDDPAHVAANRAALRLSPAPMWMRQVHGCDVLDLDGFDGGDAPPEADAAVAATARRACAILVADCLPVLLADRHGRVVGAAHAGWRGLAAGVVERTVHAMRAKHPIDHDDILVWLGPCIGPRRFEVGPEVRDVFMRDDPNARLAFERGRDDRWFADLHRLAEQRLQRIGIAHVVRDSSCTVDDARRFYSYRRDGRTGRMAAIIALTSDESRGAAA